MGSQLALVGQWPIFGRVEPPRVNGLIRRHRCSGSAPIGMSVKMRMRRWQKASFASFRTKIDVALGPITGSWDNFTGAGMAIGTVGCQDLGTASTDTSALRYQQRRYRRWFLVRPPPTRRISVKCFGTMERVGNKPQMRTRAAVTSAAVADPASNLPKG